MDYALYAHVDPVSACLEMVEESMKAEGKGTSQFTEFYRECSVVY